VPELNIPDYRMLFKKNTFSHPPCKPGNF